MVRNCNGSRWTGSRHRRVGSCHHRDPRGGATASRGIATHGGHDARQTSPGRDGGTLPAGRSPPP
eukprot:16446040-Heterocapsa_arctica.AAC.1